METSIQPIDDLVVANHILARHGVLDAFGHVSVRSPDDPGLFLLSTSKAPAQVRSEDILTLTLEGQVVGDRRGSYLERFIHCEIYRARPDVMAVVHSHSPSTIPFGVAASQSLRPICHVAAGIGKVLPIFDIADECGSETDLLIRNPALGRLLANKLGQHRAVLMRGHGITVVAESLRAAVFNAYYAEVNARLQFQALALGKVKYLSDGEIDAAWATNSQVVDRAWNGWIRDLS